MVKESKSKKRNKYSTVLLVGIIVWGNGAAWRRSALSECFSSFSCSVCVCVVFSGVGLVGN